MPSHATKPRYMAQRPGAVYRFNGLKGPKVAAQAASHSLLKLQSRVAELEATLAARTHQLRLLAEDAGTDPLTGLNNRRALMQALHTASANWQRYGHKAAVLLLDLNGFKALNDTHSHAAGDAMLQAVAQLLTFHTRTTDCVARLGGDEFVVVLQAADTAAAIAKTRLLLGAIAALRVYWATEVLQVGASIGLATLAEAPQPAAALALADTRMYQFKQAVKATA